MFSLIVAIFSIALVAALALATLHYSGPSWTRSSAMTAAAALANQGEQLRGALTLYYTHKGVYPASLQDLVTEQYLKMVPVPPSMGEAGTQSTAALAFAAKEAWEVLAPGHPAFAVKESVSLAVCQELNALARGSDAIYGKVDGKIAAQCFGPASGPFTYLVGVPGAEGPTLESAVVQYNDAADAPWEVVHPLQPADLSVPATSERAGVTNESAA